MRVDVLTLFPEACEPFFSASILGKAQKAGLASIRCHNLRDFARDAHHKVDDRPFGGGPGMVMMCQPVVDAVEAVEAQEQTPATRILLTPQGARFDQAMARELAARQRLVLVAGHYEGFDDRISQVLKPLEVSIGDYVLSGGESAAMVVVDAIVRLLPGVLGDANSAVEESFSPTGTGEAEQASGSLLLEYPQYTRPRDYRGLTVPDVLLSGDHEKIRRWRLEESRRRTAQRRPDLLT